MGPCGAPSCLEGRVPSLAALHHAPATHSPLSTRGVPFRSTLTALFPKVQLMLLATTTLVVGLVGTT